MLEALEKVKNNMQIRLWALQKVPLLAWVKPRIEELNDERVVVSIPLQRRQKNHLNSMYFGVLACGADLAGGLIAFKLISEKKQPVSFVFKDFTAEFLMRPEARTYFTCEDGAKIAALVDKAIYSGERVNEKVEVIATCPAKSEDKPVAKFSLTLSLKKKS